MSSTMMGSMLRFLAGSHPLKEISMLVLKKPGRCSTAVKLTMKVQLTNESDWGGVTSVVVPGSPYCGSRKDRISMAKS